MVGAEEAHGDAHMAVMMGFSDGESSWSRYHWLSAVVHQDE